MHPSPHALRPVDELLCAQALGTATDVCHDITLAMPFASWCDPRVEYDAEGGHCAVRLNVGFQKLDPASGVFTTSLPGILAFTL